MVTGHALVLWGGSTEAMSRKAEAGAVSLATQTAVSG